MHGIRGDRRRRIGRAEALKNTDENSLVYKVVVSKLWNEMNLLLKSLAELSDM
jgi:hypothetical protein